METLLKFFLEVYEKTGALGLLVFLLIFGLFVIGSLYVRSAKKQSGEVSDARNEVKEIQAEMRKQLEAMLADCRRECDEKALEVQLMKESNDRMMERLRASESSELILQREVNVLRGRIRKLEGGDMP